MPGTYIVNFSNPATSPIVVPPLTVNESTSIKMTGYRYPVYGELIWENLLHLAEHFANDLPPSNPITGQLWVDTTNTPHSIKVYDSTTNTWSMINHEVTISTTTPTHTNGLWFNPSNKSLNYWNGAVWINILCLVIANTSDYNEVVGDVNTLLTKYGQTLLPVVTTATLTNWNTLVAKIRQLAEYRRLPEHVVNRLTTITTTEWCTTSTLSVWGVMKKFDLLLRALDQVANSTDVDPTCMENTNIVGAQKIRTTPWKLLTHTITFQHASQSNLEIFFQTGGSYKWDGEVTGSSLSPIAQEWQLFLDNVGVIDISWTATKYKNTTVGPGIRELTTTPIILWQQTVIVPGYYSPYYSVTVPPTAQQPSLIISGIRTSANQITIIVKFSGPDTVSGANTISTFTCSRVGPPCLDPAPAWPTLVSSTLV